MSVQGLSAEITADASDFISSLEVAQESAEDLGDEATRVATKMQLLQGRIDEAGEESRELAGEATVAGLALNSLSGSSGRASLSLSSLLTSTVGVTGALSVMTATATAAAAAVASVGAAVISLAGIGGLLLGAGLLTNLERIKSVASDVAEQVTRALAPLGRTIGPLIVDALRAIPTLIRRIVNSIGGVQQFAAALRDLGAIAMQTIPPLVGAMADFARAVLPALRRVASFIGGRGSNAFRTLERSFMRMSTALGMIAVSVIDLLPTLIKFGTTLVQLFGPTLSVVVSLLDGFLEAVNGLASVIPSRLMPVLGALISLIVGGLIAASLTPATIAIAGVVVAVGALSKAWQALGKEIRSGITGWMLKGLSLLSDIANLAYKAAAGLATLAAIAGMGGPMAQLKSGLKLARGLSVTEGGLSGLKTADPTAGTGGRRRNEARRGNPSAREGSGLPPIEIVGNTEAIEGAGYRGADQRFEQESDDARGRGRRRGLGR
jgi:phage-related minor tail protein